MNRRVFLIVLGGTAAAAASGSFAQTEEPAASEILDAGSLTSFGEEKVYDQFRDQGVLIVRKGDDLFALSPICTHRGCKVRTQDDRSFLCKCHGSRFDPAGKVLKGPAVKDLLRLKLKLNSEDHVLVHVVKPALNG